MNLNSRRRVAIACQGGGSHAAFTAGALDVLLSFFLERRDDYEIVAFSGTSGGAVCAYLAWSALSEQPDEQRATEVAVSTLRSFWTLDNSAYWKARDPGSALDVVANSSLALLNLWRAVGEAVSGVDLSVQLNPYDPQWQHWARHWRERFKKTIQENVDKVGVGTTTGQDVEEPTSPGGAPMLFIGAVNALTGEFHVFKSHREEGNGFVSNYDEEDRISVDAVLASAAIPFVFEATHTGEAVYWGSSPTRDGREWRTCTGKGVYWDGLYSQNPPVRELADADPDEIWIIQIDPEEVREEPETTADIEDRRNELAGNVSLNQELYFVRKTNQLVKRLGEWEETGGPAKVLRVPRSGRHEKTYRTMKVRRVEITQLLGFASKLDRSPSHLKRLLRDGEEQATYFLEAIDAQISFEETWDRVLWGWQRRNGKDPATQDPPDVDAAVGFFADEPVIELVPPVDSAGGPGRTAGWKGEGSEWLRRVLEWCVRENVTLEQSRDYRAREIGPEKVFTCWALLTADSFDGPIKIRVKAVVRAGKVERLMLYPLGSKTMRWLKQGLESLDEDTGGRVFRKLEGETPPGSRGARGGGLR
ncbi:MAG TPA: patatin-like phospholipase family protein [Rubrobacteraceae bacterium]|nr:patatin-like phospholipase family protein [Rubrobacteraceae bacterium]